MPTEKYKHAVLSGNAPLKGELSYIQRERAEKEQESFENFSKVFEASRGAAQREGTKKPPLPVGALTSDEMKGRADNSDRTKAPIIGYRGDNPF